MNRLDVIIEDYIKDIEFLQSKRVIAEKREKSLLYYNSVVRQFIDGISTLDDFRHALKRLYQDTFWGAHGTFLRELNKLAKYHVPSNLDAANKLRTILHDLSPQNVGLKIEQLYNFLSQEKRRLEIQRIAENKIVSPRNSALIVSLISFWLNPIGTAYICYPSLLDGVSLLLNEKLLADMVNISVQKDFSVKSQDDYKIINNVIEALATERQTLRFGEYWAENFFLWLENSRWNDTSQYRKKAQRSVFSYAPLPSNASKVAITCIKNLGFAEAAIVEDYKFSTTPRDYVRLNAVVFAHPSRRDLDEFASITVLNAVNGHSDSDLVNRSAETSAPIHLIHHKNGFALWMSSIRVDEDKKRYIEAMPIDEFIPYDRLDTVMHSYINDIKPEHIIEVKQGRDTFKHSQFHSIDLAHLTSWAKNRRRNPLIKIFKDIINRLTYQYSHQLSPNKTIIEVVTQLFCLLTLADIGYLGDDIRIDKSLFTIDELITRAHKKDFHFFDHDLLLNRYPDIVKVAYNSLKHMHYTGFTPDVLSELYSIKRSSINYHIPIPLARHILDNIPLEYLRPQERAIADFTCGWGSLLIAGVERLSCLSDADEVPLQRCIYGNDLDGFATQLTKFGLIYTTGKDDWDVNNNDIFQQANQQTIQAGIAICNTLLAKGRKNLEENEITREKYIEYVFQQLQPSRYLVFILPLSFASSQSDSIARKKLREECEILEMWELPNKLFPEIAIECLVIIAQKKAHIAQNQSLTTYIRVRTLQPSVVDNFKNSGMFTTSATVTNQMLWRNGKWSDEEGNTIDCVFDYTTILPRSLWNKIEKSCIKLGDYTDNKIESFSKKNFLSQKEKISLQYIPNEQWGKRVKCISIGSGKRNHSLENIYLIDPTVTLWSYNYDTKKEALEAILEWDVSNSWMIEHTKSLDVLKHSIQNIPIPGELNDQDWNDLAESALIQKSRNSVNFTPQEVSEARNKIDTILRKAYHLDDAMFLRLRKVLQWQDRFYNTLDEQPDLDQAKWFTSGVVEKIVAGTDKIQLWIDGFDDLQTVRIVSSMPGWMLRPGAAFLTKIPREFRRLRKINPENVAWAYFRPQPYMYMSEEELLTGISHFFVEYPQ